MLGCGPELAAPAGGFWKGSLGQSSHLAVYKNRKLYPDGLRYVLVRYGLRACAPSARGCYPSYLLAHSPRQRCSVLEVLGFKTTLLACQLMK